MRGGPLTTGPITAGFGMRSVQIGIKPTSEPKNAVLPLLFNGKRYQQKIYFVLIANPIL